MLTRRGWALTISSFLMIAVGRILGVRDFYFVGTTGLTVCVLAIAYVHVRRFDVAVGRSVSPSRVHANTPVNVTVRLYNQSRVTTPPLVIRDTVSRWGQARYLAGPVPPRQTLEVEYRVPSHRRGKTVVGPLELASIDAFGLAVRSRIIDVLTELTIYPQVIRIAPIVGAQSSRGQRNVSAAHQIEEKTAQLREFTDSDDARRIHWPSSLRTGQLLVREQEVTALHDLTVVLDNRVSVAHESVLDQMVTAAASVIASAREARQPFRLLSASGFATEFGVDDAHFYSILEYLAGAEPIGNIDINPEFMGRSAGTTVVITSQPLSSADTIKMIPKRHTTAPLVMVEFRNSDEAASAIGDAHIVIRQGEQFASAWNRTIGYRTLVTQ